MRLPNATHLGAQVVRLDIDRDSVWRHHPLEFVRDLERHPFLQTEAPRDDPDKASQLADADDPFVGDIPHVDVSEEWQGMVFTQGEERDRALDDLGDLAICATMTLGREGGEKLWIPLVPDRCVEQRPQEPARGSARTWGVEVEAESAEDLGEVALIAEPIVLRDDPWLVWHRLVIKVTIAGP